MASIMIYLYSNKTRNYSLILIKQNAFSKDFHPRAPNTSLDSLIQQDDVFIHR